MNLIEELQIAFRKKSLASIETVQPLSSYRQSGDSRDMEKGQELLSQGKVGCIVLAGGQGSRLGWPGPKGTFPLLYGRHQSLFQLLSERRKAASNLYDQMLPLAIMTSPLNYEETRCHLQMHGNVPDLFLQEMAPFLDEKGTPAGIEGPNGNGEVFHRFYQSGLWAKWKKMGVEYLHVIPIDNPLADPFDANLCGFHARNLGEVVVKGIFREKPEEPLGVIGQKEGRLQIIEYFELPEEEKIAQQVGHLKWHLAHISLFCFHIDFVERAQNIQLPWHFAKKQADGRLLYKPERFIFDLLTEIETANVLIYPRSEAYAPLKNATGENSPETVRAALLQADRRQFARENPRLS